MKKYGTLFRNKYFLKKIFNHHHAFILKFTCATLLIFRSFCMYFEKYDISSDSHILTIHDLMVRIKTINSKADIYIKDKPCLNRTTSVLFSRELTSLWCGLGKMYFEFRLLLMTLEELRSTCWCWGLNDNHDDSTVPNVDAICFLTTRSDSIVHKGPKVTN